MQAAFLLVIAASAAWVGIDASKRDWTDNGFARNTASWVVGCLLLWVIVFPVYILMARKKAPLLEQPPLAPEPLPAAEAKPALPLAAPAAETVGPSIDELSKLEPEPEPEPVVELEPVVEREPEPVIELEPVVEREPEPVIEIEPVVERAPEPVIEIEPVVERAPEPVIELDHAVSSDPEPEPVAAFDPSGSGTGVDWAALAAADQELAPADDAPVANDPIELASSEEAPGALSHDAFKDIKPVAFGALAPDPVEPEPVAAIEPEPEPAVALPVEPEPVLAPEPEAIAAVEPVPEPIPLSEPVLEPEPVALSESVPEPEPEAVALIEPEPEPTPAPKKRRSKFNLELKLPSFGKKAKQAPPAAAPDAGAATTSSKKGGFVSLPPQLQGPLTKLEQKIVIGSAICVAAAAVIGYTSAPQSAAAPAAPPVPAAPATAP